MRILVTGKNGQLGGELQYALMPIGEVVALDRSALDLSRPETVRAVIDSVRPDVIVNAAAYTAVDRAETEEALATTINGEAVGELAEAARRQRALLVHYSTDYVFDGTAQSPYTERSPTNPTSAYGRSKLAGERALEQVGGDWLVFRTAWVYGTRGRNFMRTIAKAALERETLRVVADQHGTPTAARIIADETAHALKHVLAQRGTSEPASGIYHLTSNGRTTWHAFAQQIVDSLRASHGDRVATRSVDAITTAEFNAPAPRPHFSVLDCRRFDDTFGVVRPEWDHVFRLIMSDYLRYLPRE
ncbi:dTDP-4-dehydrorhamnose reductase [Paraburkholderia terrae]|uniref:dTDP-4-dehydrorhamnose reductase n=1 Tax=Paraburkholderia terrae TaxID=311230 RepID=UPI00200B62D3|nr:dTDP-4-dehydrorhamnose reductase [Paraburkholderia terrae]BDC39230.1 NAD(P)-dependent oxidoreductase [Paraburkholderia terrae]